MNNGDSQSAIERRAGWIVFLLGFFVLLPCVWSETSVTGGDEYIFTLRTPMEMRERGDLVTPWLDGQPRLRKPPLVYWAIYGSYEIFGVNVFAGRLIGVIAGSALAAASALLARELFARGALLTGLMALATIGLASEGRRAMLDVPVAAFSSFSVLYFIRWIKSAGVSELVPGKKAASHSISQIAVCAAFLGLGVLTKGPVALLFGGAGIVTAMILFRRQIHYSKSWTHFILAVLVFAVIALPWPLTMYARWGEKLTGIMREELAERQFGGVRASSPLSAWAGALGLVFPWTFLVLAGIWHRFRDRSAGLKRERLWLILWFALSALPFFFMKAFERYMLALIPAQTALAAAWIGMAAPETRRIILAISFGLLATVAIAVAAFALWFRLGVISPIVSAALAIALLAGAIRNAPPTRLAVFAAALFTCVFGFIYPTLGIGALPRELPAETAEFRSVRFNTAQPAMLSSRLGYSIQDLSVERIQNSTNRVPLVVFLEDRFDEPFKTNIAANGWSARELASYRTFYSRKSWLRFARLTATPTDWREAFRTRSLDGLKATFHVYLLTPE